jgi:GDSL-like Lipase/Acylhydrolase family
MKTMGLALLGWLVVSMSHHSQHFAWAYTSDGRLVVTQLGDSYSSGNGARDVNGAVNYAGVPECLRSPTTWGAQATAALPFPTVYVNRACSGGIIADMTNPRGLNTRFSTKTNGFCNATPAPYAPEEYYVESNPSCPNALQSQNLGVTKETDFVLLASGGNDFRFGTIILDCLTFNVRSIPKCQAAMNFVYANLNTFGTALTNALLSIKPLLNEKATIVVVAYPHIVLNTPETYDPISPFEPGTLEITNNLRNLGLAVEQSQRAAVAAANKNSTREFVVFYNGTKALFEGHEPHPKFFSANPNRWINEHFPDGGNTAEVYHLNPIGHNELGKAMAAFLSSRILAASPMAPVAPPVMAPVAPPAMSPTAAAAPVAGAAPKASPMAAPVLAAPSSGLRPPTKAPLLPTASPPLAPVSTLRKCRGPLRCLFRRIVRCQC